MSLNRPSEPPPESSRQSPGADPKTKRNSGLFAFFKWFKPTPSTSRESIDRTDDSTSSSSSCDSLNSVHSTGTVASFSYVPPSAYTANKTTEKCIAPGPETDTYRARLKQRDKRRESDKNITLRKKYNLFFHRDTFLRPKLRPEEETTRSLPLMTRPNMEVQSEETAAEKMHRRTNSESSKTKKAGAYLHVRGKRRAPQPPGLSLSNNSTLSLRRKKRLAPAPPSPNKITQCLDQNTIFNDSLKLECGILKPREPSAAEEVKSSTVTIVLDPPGPVSPRPWYKRNHKESKRVENKYEPIEKQLPEVQFVRNSVIDLTVEETVPQLKHQSKKAENNKRKSGISFLTNISELDREASEIVTKNHQRNNEEPNSPLPEIPPFMRPKEEPKINNGDSWISPKRRSARDLIAKFNAITNVTKVTVMNSAFFSGGSSPNSKKDYFNNNNNDSNSNNNNKKQESLLESHKKRIEQIDQRKSLGLLMKSESTSAIKHNPPKPPEAPKPDKKSWNCPKCSVENDYWRIICHVCSTIKPYFDDFSHPSPSKPINSSSQATKKMDPPTLFNLERSKTQIGFSALASYNNNANKVVVNKSKIGKSISLEEKSSIKDTEERERLKKMLIEMKNSLPKRKSNILMKQNSRTSVIVENPEPEKEDSKIINDTNLKPASDQKQTQPTPPPTKEVVKKESVKTKEEPKKSNKIEPTESVKQNDHAPLVNLAKPDSPKDEQKDNKFAQVVIATTTTVYENVKVKKPDPVQATSLVQPPPFIEPPNSSKADNFEPMKLKDFEDIYSGGDPNSQSAARIYANLVRNDELSIFFNMPRRFSDIKNNINDNSSTDTIEINRLLRRLESSIAKGEMTEAASYAKELAQLKINCSVIRQEPGGEASKTKRRGFNIEMYVEDKVSHRGPFQIEVTEKQTVAELKKQIELNFEIPVDVQRWILGKELATDDKATLKDYHITNEGCPVFLYLVAPSSDGGALAKASKNKEEVKPSTSAVGLEINGVKKKDRSVMMNKDNNINERTNDRIPKIVEVIPKVAEPTTKIEPGPSKFKSVAAATDAKTLAEVTQKEEKGKEVIGIAEGARQREEDDDPYDYSKTLKPQSQQQCKEWQCHLCTLLNPVTSNICAVCATVRQKADEKKVKKMAPQPTRAPLVKPETIGRPEKKTYLQLVDLDNADLVITVEPFECLVCFLEIAPGDGVTLRECLHQFCKQCLAHNVEYTEDAEVKCPFRDDQYSCNIALQDREIKALVTPQIYEQYLVKSVTVAENKMGKSFHCKTPDCKGWCIFEDNVNDFRCPVCRRVNCLTCQAIHTEMNCKQYQEKMNKESEVDDDAKQTKQMVDEMVRKGEALTCPTCQVILMKKWGCDWVRCSMCKTEICWVTRGPRWGPGGKGDTSGGCQCGVNGVKCHPQCSYCH